MALDTTKPTDTEPVAELPRYIREDRAAINATEVDADNISTTVLPVSAGDTVLVVGTDLSATKIESVIISGVGASTLAFITGGTEGQIKIFIFQDNNISLQDGVKADGRFYLNQLPALTIYNAQQNDVMAFSNIGGDGAAVPGYWKELWRQIAVK